MPRLALPILPLALALGGCNPNALILRRDAPPLEGRVLSSDPEIIVVETPDGRTVELRRSEIEDIDHPGNVAMALGLPNTVVGSLFGVITIFMLPAAFEQGWPENTEERLGAAPVALGFGLIAAANLAVGLPPFLWGSEAWFTSTGNAQPTPRQPSGVSRLNLSPAGLQVRF